ncbi:dolichyl-phosphate-mannose-proteinmannosyltransferase [Wickerhamomyces ciferrii]|uniref:Dolichyl-phosphate-mannose--protein mannosyltransferase n=1 Tax=Wickerhamomyces ciferrii (strain ATCC 14091 / BCRC 22168 / CBS 111 / JCM 3599 / NBRC 0793 / NRRL Y-1031 F-60-10) TaxID=1206466 RepID=K0KMF8_WICCF|nr:dolichyl-phosphate-mannose-proteinmannosyltransferase [Wickerhamomyces ciferrii]CCH42273.1 dolichyl-phosphate-mannose-proteinmannosyltransferase [Wickerhamomyces ciferrii]
MAPKKTKQSSNEKKSQSSKVDELDTVPEFVFEKGVDRPFLITTPPANLAQLRSVSSTKERLFLVGLILFAVIIRLQKLYNPNSVVFDEVHFGGFAKKYILGTFFMDVHPPLAKLLFAGVASLAGFKGDFDFEKIGDVFTPSTPYFWMRLFPASLGVATVVLLYLTLRASGVRPFVALLSGLIFTYENANVTISRYILLDSPLLFFIAAAAYGAKRFENEIPFSIGWYRALVATGIALGLAVSSKWVGLFTIAWVGLLNVWDLWFLIGDLTVSVNKVVRHTLIRGTVLLGVPIILYITFFAVHFQVLNQEGEGGAFMTSAFRSTLQNNKIPGNIPANVGVGSTISIRHVNTQGGYLHSHDHLYETGSKQQQITLYPHLDANNHWLVELYNVSEAPTQFEPIQDGTKIRLKHIFTHRRLHSHDHKAPVSENDWNKEVSAYGFEDFEGDANDDFVVEIQKAYTPSQDAQVNLTALESVFRLRHAMTGCYLFSHEVKLPKWGFEQQEVTCATQGILKQSLWHVEHNENPFLPEDTRRVSYQPPSLWAKIVESHKKMWQINQNLNAPHNWQSLPNTWPFLTRGINYWGDDNRHIYLLGNAPTWWATTLAITIFLIYAPTQILRWQKGAQIGTDRHVYNFNVQTFKYILGYLVHFAPSFLMGRQLFLHHYLPAFYFAVLTLAHFFDILVTYIFSRKRTIGYALIVTFALVSFLFYVNYSPLIYGTPWTKAQCEASKLLEGWDYDCNKFLENLSDYNVPPKLFEPVESGIAQNA